MGRRSARKRDTPDLDVKVFPSFHAGNAEEIMLYLLSAESREVCGSPQSTHPFELAGVRYTPCEVLNPYATHGGEEWKCIHSELHRLYDTVKMDEEALPVFWKTVDTLLKEGDTAEQWGTYGFAELLEGLYGMGERNISVYDIPHTLKGMLVSDKYKGQQPCLWPDEHENDTPWDLHWKIIRAYVSVQRDESFDFWKNIFDEPPASPRSDQAKLILFRGMLLCDCERASSYLSSFESETDRTIYRRAKHYLEEALQDAQ